MSNSWKMLAVLAVATVMPAVAQTTGTLKVKVNPSRAGIFVDGKYLGPSANFGFVRKYPLPAGEHELILREPRYEEVRMKVTIVADKQTYLEQEMKAKPVPEPPYGTLRVSGFEKYAPVYLNGEFMGHADEFDAGRQGLLLKPGEYQLKITSPEGATLLERVVTIKENQVEVAKK